MDFDEQTCEQARLNRDARFDGRIFIGITTTGVYCRPVCPSPHARRENVRYFPSAAAAAEAGFRPCLRCRPEVAPGTPAWNGTSTTVSRGLRLIAEGALDASDIEALAERLGVTSRHLSRLFLRHLGASPTTIARTRRVLFAKQLLSDTNLTIAQIAMAAGFGSIRRFNDVFRQYYGRPPSEVRRLGRPPSLSEGEYVLRLAFRPPYDWDALLRFLAARAIPGVESARGGAYRRTILAEGCQGLLEVRPEPGLDMLRVRIQLPRPESLLQVVTQTRAMFDLAADPELIERHLGADPLLAPLLRAHPGRRLPGAWDACEVVIQALLDERCPPSRTRELLGLIAERYGAPVKFSAAPDLTRTFPRAQVLAAAGLDGLPGPAAQAVRAAARVLCTLEGATWRDQLLGQLRAAVQPEDSTLQYIAMRALDDPDAFPAEGWRVATGAGGAQRAPAGWQSRVQGWRPWRSYAALYLLDAASAG